ncbi:mRNA interferase MazF [Acidipropionibacterium jensenii]|uniref:mRNA interferase MazF n=1 Tax=Acidipropionibacterium jensenii TaxID=1749 RepID=A0A3S4V3G0_9ACTN|nr:type II toxin-antitoxin system PemK/MazF family toxin [Acidipropionibacterium jensenii]VEI03878.1 mRNA interferase MazF [Acidipropionibacterium jensenii]
MPDLSPGDIVWVFLDPVVGREQSGRRPAVVVSSRGHLLIADTLVIVVPVTSVDRGWSNHIPLRPDALQCRSWAMNEQLRTISREHVVGRAGRVDPATLAEIRRWITDFVDE